MIRSAFIVSLLGLALTACSSSPERLQRFHSSTGGSTGAAPMLSAPQETRGLIARSSDHQKVGNPYTVAGQRFVPYRDDDYDEIGIGSWYGPNFHGRPTANGEVFDQHQMTAAHTTLPIPSIVEVTNLENGRQVIVRLNDRGPFVDDRIIDLSRAAAEALDYRARGLARVRVRYLGPAHANADAPDLHYQMAEGAPTQTPRPRQEAAQSTAAGLTLQLGAFRDRINADQLVERVEDAGEVWVEAGSSNGSPVYRVFFGRWNDQGAAFEARSRLAEWGVYETRMVALD